jgi:hypothetical protein
MTSVMTPPETDTGDLSPAGKAGVTIANGLAARGFDVHDPASKESCYLQVTNARASLVSLGITRTGIVDWQYHCYRTSPRDPDRMTAIVLAILNAGDDAGGPAVADRLQPTTLKGVIGRAAADLGLRASLVVLNQDDALFEIHAEVAITDPDRPRQGSVWVTDDGVIRWSCRLSNEDEGIYGLEASEIAATIARALTAAQAS